MIKIKQALFLIFGITSFIIFYIGILNYLTTTDQQVGLTILAFSGIVAIGSLVGSFYISKKLTKPIEQLTKRMVEFSKTNSISKNNSDDKEFFELQSLHKNFEEMAAKVGDALEKEKQLNTKLQEMDVRKTEFMSMVSHELKTPLMPIMGYVKMLKKQDMMGSLNERQLDAINEIFISAQNLQKLIQDVLMVQKIDLGKLSVDQKVTSSDSLVENAYNSFIPVCQEKNVKLIISISAKDKVYSDKDRIAQVFSNLICNALSFVPEKNGTIEIGTQDNLDYVIFYVKDNGVGLSISQQKNIFKKFYQTDTSSKRKKDGSGLGLSICEGIVKALGGKIWVQSSENKGATFYFSLPKAKIPLDTYANLKNTAQSI